MWDDLRVPLEAEKHREQHREDLLLHDTDVPPKFATVRTTAAPVTTLLQVELEDNAAYVLELTVVARRTGGSAGTAGDKAGYVRRALVGRVSAGSAVLTGPTQDVFTREDQAGWDCDIDVSGNDARARVTGAANTNITWNGVLTMWKVNR